MHLETLLISTVIRAFCFVRLFFAWFTQILWFVSLDAAIWGWAQTSQYPLLFLLLGQSLKFLVYKVLRHRPIHCAEFGVDKGHIFTVFGHSLDHLVHEGGLGCKDTCRRVDEGWVVARFRVHGHIVMKLLQPVQSFVWVGSRWISQSNKIERADFVLCVQWDVNEYRSVLLLFLDNTQIFGLHTV